MVQFLRLSAQSNDPVVLQEKRFSIDEVQLGTASFIDPPAGNFVVDKPLEIPKNRVSLRCGLMLWAPLRDTAFGVEAGHVVF
jgi:hypothetical protein